MNSSRTRKVLSPGTIVRMPDGFCCQITGAVISEGGGSIIYPVSRVRIDAQGVRRQEMEYALKECFPISDRHRFGRREDGAVVAEDPAEGAEDFLAYVKKMQLTERDATSRIYHTAFRMVPIVESAEEVELSFDEGRTFHAVGNVMTVMESLAGKGTTLRAFLADNTRGVPALVALRIIQQVLFALREVHDAGYLHLDIQDGNILLQGNLDDGSIQATLIDFGSARPLQDDGLTAPIQDRALFSTRGFSAPEMARNDGTLRLGPQADLYSTGYLLLFLLTGTRYDPRSLANAHGGQVLTPMRMRHTQCPTHLQGALQALLQKALTQDPTARYATADEMLREVTALADALAPKPSVLAAVAYDAFICYKHNERNDRAAATLRHALEHYRIPTEVQKASGKQRFDRVFLDTDELSSCANLGAAIKDALVSASWLIVVCSPETPTSPWVAQEIDTFLEHHDASHILTVLTAGEPDESFPERLRTASRDDMMFAADARAATLSDMEKAIRRDTVLRVAAPMLGVSYDALKQRRRAWQMRRAMAALGVVLAVALAFAGVMWQDNLRIQAEYEKAQIRESHYLAQESERALLQEDNRFEAVRIALQALPSSEQSRPYVAEAERALSMALRHYGATNATTYEARLDAGGEVSAVCISDDLRYVTITSIADTTIWVSTWDAQTGQQLWKKRLGDLATTSYGFVGGMFSTGEGYVKYAPGTDTLVVGTFHAVAGVDAGTGNVLWNKELYTVEGNTIYGMLHDVVFPKSENSDTAYLFREPEKKGKGTSIQIDAVDVESGDVKRTVSTGVNVTWSYEDAFLVAPSQDYALMVGAREDDDSEYTCVSLSDGSTVASGKLEGLPMNAWVHGSTIIAEDWFVATYQPGADDAAPGTMRLYRIEKGAGSHGAAANTGRSWVTELPMSQPWSKRFESTSRAQLSNLAHNLKKTPTAFQFGQLLADGKSVRLSLAADHDIYLVDADTGEIFSHETTDAAIVGYTWGEITTHTGTVMETPYLYYADGGIDPFLFSGNTMVSQHVSDTNGTPPYACWLNDAWALMEDADSAVEDDNVYAVVSAEEPSVVKIIHPGNDLDATVATLEPAAGRSFAGTYTDMAMANPRGDYLCAREEPAAETDESTTAREGFVLYETQNWHEQARCEVEDKVGSMLALTADGTRIIWQAKNEDDTGAIFVTELASGTTTLLPGLPADADAYYAAAVPDGAGDSLVAVLSYEAGKAQPYAMRLYRDGLCTAQTAFTLEGNGNHIVHEGFQRKSPLALSANGMVAFGYMPDKNKEVDVFVDVPGQTVHTVESPVISNSPACACLTSDGTRYASADSDGTVHVRDTRDGSLVWSCTPNSNTRGIAFIDDDNRLALYTEDYQLLTFDANSGEALSQTANLRSKEYEEYLNPRNDLNKQMHLQLEAVLSSHHPYHDITIRETENDLIVYTGLGEGCIIDRESMAVRGYVPNAVGYSASADAMLVGAPGANMLVYPVMGAEDLVAEGESLLSKGSSSTG